MRLKLLLLLITLASFNSFGQTTFTFDGDGNWTDETQWKDGLYPGLLVNLNDTVEILGKVTIPEDTYIRNDGTIVSMSSAMVASPEVIILGNLYNTNIVEFGRTQIRIATTGNLGGFGIIDITNNSTLTNSGKVTVNSGGVLNLKSMVSSIINDGTGFFFIHGTVNILNGKFENNNIHNNAITNKGTFTVNSGEIINRGGFKNDETGHLNISRFFNNEVTGRLLNNGELSIMGFTATLSNSGILNNGKNIEVADDSRLNMLSGSKFYNSGIVTVAENGKIENRAITFELREGKVINNGIINNETEIWISSIAELENNGTIENLGAQITNKGTLSGINIKHGSNFSNDGILSPGNSASAIGTYNLDSFLTNYTQTASGALNIELGGTVAGVSYDQVIINRSATLDGALNVILINGFEPAIGDVFTVLLQGRGIIGSFSTVNLPTLPAGKEWDAVEYNNNDGVRISVKKATLSISDIKAESLKYKIYPNPATDEIFVSGISMASKASIFDLNGRIILEVELSREKSSIDLNALKPGVYLLNIEAKTFKFVKL